MASTAVKAAVIDGGLTFSWMFCATALDIAAAIGRSSAADAGRSPYWELVILAVEFAVIIFVFNALAEALGGASFNPTGNACLYAAGVPGDTLLSMALRFPAQLERESCEESEEAQVSSIMAVDRAVKLAIGDAVLTGMWVFCAATLGASTRAIAQAIGVEGRITLLITVFLVAVLVFVFSAVGAMLGGASFNPTGTAAFYAAGFSKDSIFSMSLRFPAQALGAVGGALAIKEVMPAQYKHMLGGPSLKVDVHTGAIAEGVLTFIISLAVLTIILKVPAGNVVKTWLLSMTTVSLVVAGSSYTGPSMNPANAFGWAYVNNRHNTWEQFYVYWICPFVGAILAAMVYRVIFPQPKKPKKKKARKDE